MSSITTSKNLIKAKIKNFNIQLLGLNFNFKLLGLKLVPICAMLHKKEPTNSQKINHALSISTSQLLTIPNL